MSRRGAAQRFYPERPPRDESGLDKVLINALGHLKRLHSSRLSRFQEILPEVNRYGAELESLSEEELAWQVTALRPQLITHGFETELIARAFALVREFSGRRLQMRHFDVQLLGGRALLQGVVIEMRTGEGKTLAAILPACTLALAKIPVHIITVNDYLARRDAEWMRPVYEAMGLTVGVIINGMDLDERREAYRCDVTYCTNKEIAFDYLRDRIEFGHKPGQIQMRLERLYEGRTRLDRLRLQGLHFAIVDEADSVLIDEARTPLIISGTGGDSYEADIYRQALELSQQLEAETDYHVDFPNHVVKLTESGEERLETLARALGGIWSGRLRSEELVRKALSARHLYHKDKHYVLKQGKVQIVDEYTGRTMPGRSWEGGLHQLIQTKEGCEVTTQTETKARISYQRFFQRYLTLAGMTGTGREAAAEFWSVYRLEVVTIPTHMPMILKALPSRIYRTMDDKLSALVERIAQLHAKGQPVLVGTRTVLASEHLAELLSSADIPCRVLNALQDEQEAEIIGQAGQAGQVTVATNMAGRGTDIKLGPGIPAETGLLVIATERHDASRIDRQLFGRGGRQGDPGTSEVFLSLEDELLVSHPVRVFGLIGSRWVKPHTAVGRWLGRLLFNKSQQAAERAHHTARRQLMMLDANIENILAFSGQGE
jgi:preprotein translocase subunit SecA